MSFWFDDSSPPLAVPKAGSTDSFQTITKYQMQIDCHRILISFPADIPTVITFFTVSTQAIQLVPLTPRGPTYLARSRLPSLQAGKSQQSRLQTPFRNPSGPPPQHVARCADLLGNKRPPTYLRKYLYSYMPRAGLESTRCETSSDFWV